ncbi:MFS transporter [Sphingomonas flavalba]|uniref:MFS transporter n=1 Tax=Sphingomonas flavalba TaxID=2559804 RepID=UPI0039E19A7D
MTSAASDSAASRSISLLPYMLQAFACSMAMMSFVALAGPIARVLRLEPWHLGMTMTVSGIAWMIMSRVWGAASDRRGRRPILLTGVGAFAVLYLCLSIFIDVALRISLAPLAALAGLLIGRTLVGLFYAAVPAATMALVADHVPAQRRAAAMATVGAASAAGMVVGPGFAGLVAPYGMAIPLYATAALPLCAFLILWRVLPHDAPRGAANKAPLAFSDHRLRGATVTAFVAMFSVAVAQITVGFFALDRLNLATGDAARTAGVALALVGLALVCAQTVLRRLDWTPARMIRVGSVIGAAGFASVVIATSPQALWIGFTVAAFGMGWVYPSVSALAANAVKPHEQGAAAGIVGAAQGLGTICGPIAGTVIHTADPGLPYVLTAAMLLATAMFLTERTPASG